jgi:hypothetical protein
MGNMNVVESTLCRRVIDNNKGSKHTAFIIGGFGMSKQQLLRYMRLYLNMGFAEVKMFTPPMSVMTIPALCEKYAKRMIEIIRTQDEGIHFHLFSGSVWIFYALNDLCGEDMRRRIHSVVMESTPLDVKAEQFGRFLAWRLKRRYQAVYAIPFMFYRWFVRITPAWENRNRRRMLDVPQHCSLLCVYSKSDQIVDPLYIENYLHVLSIKGVNVKKLVLDQADHCHAIRDCPDKYEEAILSTTVFV